MAQIDVTNRFAVGVRGNRIVVLKWGRELTYDDAMNLAAWIVASAEAISGEQAEDFDAETNFDTWLNAVRST